MAVHLPNIRRYLNPLWYLGVYLLARPAFYRQVLDRT